MTPSTPAALERAHGAALGAATLKSRPEDFIVDERPSWRPDGDGAHVVLRVEKRGCNTGWVAGRLAAIAGCPGRDVGYAGIKDRHALTRQWFSVPAAADGAVDWTSVSDDGFRVIEAARHRRKLRRGALAGNDFELVLRDVDARPDAIDERLETIRLAGVPNYFGEQRFGRGGANLRRARELLVENRRMRRSDRAFAISAARAEIFNACLAERIRRGNWDRAVDGDLVMLDGTHSVFVAAAADPDIAARVGAHDLHPTGPLWGRGEPRPLRDAAEIECGAVAQRQDLADGLERAGAAMQRRSLRAIASNLEWSVPDPGALLIRFGLPAGAYATVLLAEVFEIRDAGGG